MSLLRAKNLVVSFGGLLAVNRVSLDVEAGETLGIIGPNGSGKTTLFNLVTGIYRPSEGQVWLQSQDITGLPAYQIARRGVARTFQISRLFLKLSVIDNILAGMAGARPASWLGPVFRPTRTTAEMRELADRAWALLAAFGEDLLEYGYRPARELTLVDRRRLELCRALAENPRVLLLDEPSAGMDAEETLTLLAEIRRLRSERPNLCVVVIEHDMDVVRELTDRVIVLDHGQKIAEGAFTEVAANTDVQAAYLGT